MRCGGCGAEQPEGARFCFSCGAAVQPPACASCGQPLVAGARFCSECGAAQKPSHAAPPTAPSSVAARRVTSVLFGDLVGFTTLAESRDQEDTRELLSRYFEECRQIVARYGGTVEKFIGDAVMAVWGVPTTHEDDAERSVRAGLELVNSIAAMGEDVAAPDLAMRVGIVTGEVAVTLGAEHQGMVAGDAVNTAARVQSVAGPGQVWVDETTRLLTASAITYVDVGSHGLKGKAEPVPLWSVRAVVAARGGAQRADGLEAALVGRERELRLVKELFHVAEETGQPSLVVVDGDPGVGKSRLAWEFEKYVDGLSRSVRWHSGRCLAYGDGVAFYALADAVRGRLGAGAPDLEDEDDVDPERLLDLGLEAYVADPEERAWLRPRLGVLLGSGSVGTFAREDLFSAWATFFERVGAAEQAVVLVMDDAQYADEGLVQFLEHLLTVAAFPCFVLLLARPGLLEAHPGLATNRRATVVHLPTLTDDGIAEMLGGLVAGLPDRVLQRLVERAEGVPLFAVETVRSLIDRDLVVPRGGQYVLADAASLDLDSIGAPASLQALISARLDTLSPRQRGVVDRACVLGGSFHPDEIAALCSDVDGLEQVLAGLVRLQILSRETSRLSAEYGHYRFVQSVVRQVAYATLSRRDRKRSHLDVVELLRLRADSSEDVVPVLAQHLLDAIEAVPGDVDVPDLQRDAITQLERAADRAARLGAPGEAAGHLDTALRHASELSDRARLLSAMAWQLVRAGQYDAAARHATEATEAFDALGDDVAAGLAAARHAVALSVGLGDNERALAIAEPRWAALQDRPGATEALLVMGEAIVTARLRTSRDVRDVIETRLRLAERAEDTAAIADSLIALALHYSNVGVPTLNRMLLRAGADMARAQHRTQVFARAMINLTVDALTEDVEAAVAYGRESLEVSLSTGATNWISFSRINLCIALLEQGSWDEAEAILSQEDAEPLNRAAFVATEAVIRIARAEPWSLPWDPSARPLFDDKAVITWQAHAESLAARSAGDLDTALARAMEAVRTGYAVMAVWDDFPVLWSSAAELAVELGADEAVEELLSLAGHGADRVPLPLVGHRSRILGLWSARNGDDEAADHLSSAVEAYTRWGSVVHRAKALGDLGVWLSRNGRAGDGAPMVAEAGAVFDRLGAVAWRAELDHRLLTVG